MCSEIDRFSSFLRRNMSSSGNELFTQDDKAKSLLISDKEEIASEMESEADDRKEVEKIKNEDDRNDVGSVSVSVSSEKQLPEDDEDGFRTPTSLDHKIPAITECPPAPKKPRPEPSRLKRKASPPLACELDATAEIESIFLPISSQDSREEKKLKKARTENED